MPADPMASHRAELLGRLAGAQFQLEALIAQLRHGGSGTALAAGEDGLLDLAALQRRVATADPTSLVTLRAEVAGTIGSVTAKAEQARAAASASAAGAEIARTLAEASAAARASVQEYMRDIYGRKIFDPYLRFASAEDETAYRNREQQTRRAIEAALAKHTPEGDLCAARLMKVSWRMPPRTARTPARTTRIDGATWIGASPTWSGPWEKAEMPTAPPAPPRRRRMSLLRSAHRSRPPTSSPAQWRRCNRPVLAMLRPPKRRRTG